MKLGLWWLRNSDTSAANRYQIFFKTPNMNISMTSKTQHQLGRTLNRCKPPLNPLYEVTFVCFHLKTRRKTHRIKRTHNIMLIFFQMFAFFCEKMDTSLDLGKSFKWNHLRGKECLFGLNSPLVLILRHNWWRGVASRHWMWVLVRPTNPSIMNLMYR